MSGTKAATFFWSDWRSDTNLQLCSHSAKGLWMDLLCICADNEGYVRVAGRDMTPEEIARATHGEFELVVRDLAELERNEVFSRTRGGSIYCRRMIKSEINRRNGQAGGVAKSRKFKANQNSLQETGLPLIPSTDSDTLPEIERGGDSRGVVVRDDWPEDHFERFKAKYPPGRRGEWAAVEAKMAKIRKSGVSFAKLMAGLDRFVATRPDPKFTAAPLVWLNKGRWDVEYEAGCGPGAGDGLSMFDIAAGNHRGERR